MNAAMVLRILKKDAAVGPRSPIVLFAVAMPILLTVVLQLVFGNLLDSSPRLAVVDMGNSEVRIAAEDLDTLRVTRLEDEQTLRQRVADGDFDAGLILPDRFDEAVRAGERPLLQLFISGESYAVDRLIVAVTTVDLVRNVEGRTPPVDVNVVDLGSGDPIPLSTRFVPVIAMYAFVIAGLFVPASSIVEERERKTLTALLSTPATLTDVLAAKALLGIGLTIVMTVVTLQLNGAFGPDYASMLGVLAVTSVFWSLLGLVVGLLAKNSQVLFAIVKGSGIVLFAPVIFYLFPDWPQWIARIFPTYWAIDPLWRIISNGETFLDVWFSLAVVVGMCVVLVPVVRLLRRRAQAEIAGGA